MVTAALNGLTCAGLSRVVGDSGCELRGLFKTFFMGDSLVVVYAWYPCIAALYGLSFRLPLIWEALKTGSVCTVVMSTGRNCCRSRFSLIKLERFTGLNTSCLSKYGTPLAS